MENIQNIWPEWQVEGEIGAGAYGSVYKVSKDVTGKKIYAAIKIIKIPQTQAEIREWRSQGMDNESIRSHYEERLERLNSEILILEELKTANNIVTIEEYKLLENENGIGGTLYIRMELLQSVEAYLQSDHKFSVGEVVQLGIDMCSALMACDHHQIIHRDIKPSNILINEYGEYKLGDFGISKQLEDVTSARSKTGTEMYMAPEIYKAKSYNKTVDIYSLGITLYKLLNDNRFPYTPPYPQSIRPVDLEEAMLSRLEGKPMKNPANADEELSRIVKKACESDPIKRYQSAEQMKRDLMRWQADNLSDDTKENVMHSDIYDGIPEEELEKTQGGQAMEKQLGELSDIVNETFIDQTTDTEKTVSAFEKTESAFGKTESAFEKEEESKTFEEEKPESHKEEPKSTEKEKLRGRDIKDTLRIGPELIGTTVVYKRNGQEIKVQVPFDAANGTILRIRGKGEAVQDGINGDLCLRVKLVNDSEKKVQKEKLEESSKSFGRYLFWWIMSGFGKLGLQHIYMGDWGAFWRGRICWGVLLALVTGSLGISIILGDIWVLIWLVDIEKTYKAGELTDGKGRVIVPKKKKK